MNLTWCSRHPLAADQIADLRVHLGLGDDEPLTVTTENVVWAASHEAEADWNTNRETWKRLVGAAEAEGRRNNRVPYIAGVFPPVALESIRGHGSIRLLTPVSRQAPELRIGEGPIPFVHVRWAMV
jgi:hypothetical protein